MKESTERCCLDISFSTHLRESLQPKAPAGIATHKAVPDKIGDEYITRTRQQCADGIADKDHRYWIVSKKVTLACHSGVTTDSLNS